MSTVEKIFNALVLYHYNMRALHWKIKGVAFDTKHALAGDYYEKFDNLIDEVAEILLMIGQSPKDLKTIIDDIGSDEENKYLLISCEDNSYYTEEQMLTSINTMFDHLIKLYDDACNDNSIPVDVINKLQEHQYYFRLEGKYKGKNRMMK